MMIRKSIHLLLYGILFNAVFVHGDAVDDAMFYGRVQVNFRQPVP